MTSSPFRVLGVDPGSFATGWGLVRREGARLHLEASGVIRPPRNRPFEQRLEHIHRKLAELIAEHGPDAFAIEAVFHAEHARSALQLGHARGVLVLAAIQAGLALNEYPPATVKKAVTGNGAADKEQVRSMVQMLLRCTIDGAADRSDALAVAICHAHAGGFTSRLKGTGRSPDEPRPGGGKLRKVKG